MVGDKVLLPFVFVVEKHLLRNISLLLGRKRSFVIGQADRLDFLRILLKIVAVCVHGEPRGMVFHDHQDEGAVHCGLQFRVGRRIPVLGFEKFQRFVAAPRDIGFLEIIVEILFIAGDDKEPDLLGEVIGSGLQVVGCRFVILDLFRDDMSFVVHRRGPAHGEKQDQ